ncbi:MAG: hypothetical protein WCY71_10125 [Halothiobacillaceae bacterium]
MTIETLRQQAADDKHRFNVCNHSSGCDHDHFCAPEVLPAGIRTTADP